MIFSLRTAAKQVGVSKSTIFRAIRAGRLSATRTADAGYDIEAAELFRVYPPQRPEPEALGHGAMGGGNSTATAAVEAQIEGLREMLRRADALSDELRSHVAEIREDRDRWRTQAESAQRLVTTAQRSWWQRLVG